MSFFEPFLPTAREALALLACMAVLFGFAALGGLVTGRRKLDGPDLLAGWGAAVTLPALLQWLAPVDLRVYAAFAGAAVIVALVERKRHLADGPPWRAALYAAPVLLVASGMPLDEWDSFSHWGINAAWLWRFDALPSVALPLSPSSNPDYPYGYPLALYFASLLRGSYIENAGAVVNALLLVFAAGAVGRVAARDDEARFRERPWTWSAWGVLAVLVLNPGFVRSTTLATYADTAFSVAVLFLGLAVWRRLAGRIATGAGLRVIGGTALALVAIKEGGLIMLGVVAVAAVIAGLRDAPARGRLPGVLAAMLPAAAAGLAWQQYVEGWLPSSFSILPMGEWRLGMLPSILGAMGGEIADHGGFYALLLVLVVLGVRGSRRNRDEGDLLLALASLVVVGHLATVMLAYLGASFTPGEVERAASFHRYATQAGLLALAALVYRVGTLIHQEMEGMRPAWIPVVACAGVMIVGAPFLHRDRDAMEEFYLSAGREIASSVDSGATIGLVGWRDEPYAYFLLRYSLFRPGSSRPGPELERVFRPLARDGADRERRLERLARQERLSHLLLIEPAGLHADPGADMLLLARRGSRWTPIDEWRME